MKRSKMIVGLLGGLMLAVCISGCGKSQESWKKAYQEVVKESANVDEELGEPKYELFYLDYDEIPEFAVCYGSAHPDRVQIYTIDTETGKAVCLGEYGEFGFVRCYPRTGMIVDSYGGQGAFTTILYQKQNAKMMVIDSYYTYDKKLNPEDPETEYVVCCYRNLGKNSLEIADTVEQIWQSDRPDLIISESEYDIRWEQMGQLLGEQVLIRYEEMKDSETIQQLLKK